MKTATVWNCFGVSTLALSALAGCSPTDSQQHVEGEWTLVSIALDSGLESRAPEGITLDISGTDASGFSGCNTYRFSFELPPDGEFRITSAIATTKKACPDEIMTFESTFLSSLASSLTIEQDGEELILVGSEAVLNFSRSEN